MRLHLLGSVVFASALLPGVAQADGDVPMEQRGKLTENAGRQTGKAKVDARISAQAQLFVEQKEAPVASKTSLWSTAAPRLSAKLKD